MESELLIFIISENCNLPTITESNDNGMARNTLLNINSVTLSFPEATFCFSFVYLAVLITKKMVISFLIKQIAIGIIEYTYWLIVYKISKS